MPRIPTYQSDTTGETNLPSPQANQRGYGFGSGLSDLASGLNDVANTLHDAEQRQEVSDVATQTALLRGKKTAELDTTASTAEAGTDIVSPFMEGLTNELATMGGKFKTKAGQDAFLRSSAELTSQFLDGATKYQIHSAGVKAVNDFKATENANIGTLMRDPTQFDSILKETDAALNDPAGMFAKMPGDKRAELGLASKEQYALAAARGIIRLNPQMALDMSKDGLLPGQEFLKEQSLYYLQNAAETAIHGQEIKTAQVAAAQKKALEDAAEKQGQEILKNVMKNPNDPNITNAILSSSMTWEKQNQMLAIVKQASKGDEDKDDKTYGTGFVRLYEQVHQGLIKSPDDLYAHVGKGDLTVAGVDKLTTEITGKRTPEGQIESDLKGGFVRSFGKVISGENELLGFRDPKGAMLNQQALAWFLTEFQRQKEEGKIPVHDLLDPANKNSLWAGVMRFKRPDNVMMKDIMEGATSLTAPTETVPAPIRTIPNLEYSPTKKAYRDPKTGKVYDAAGKEMK